MVSAQLESLFPRLAGSDYAITSPSTRAYNCIAWAARVQDEWWWPDPMGVSPWPAAVQRAETVAAFIEAFETLGFVTCSTDSVETGFEKVAIYALAGSPKHAARQLANGRWTSKLGELEDIEHALDSLEGDWYGQVVQILRRPLSP
jgi:hypothetical protein